jgi:hypothetical protein
MNPYTYDMSHALASEKLSRLRAEADGHRLAKSVKPQQPGSMDRLVQAIGQGLASIAETFKVDRRPQLPAV